MQRLVIVSFLVMSLVVGCDTASSGGGTMVGQDTAEPSDTTGQGGLDTTVPGVDTIPGVDTTGQSDTVAADTGGTPYQATCDTSSFTSCGGEPVGTWYYQDMCVVFPEGNPFQSFCEDAIMEYEPTLSGSVSFADDGTYHSTMDSSMVITVTLPLTCLPAMVTCDALAAQMEGAMCLANESECTCTMTQDDPPEDETGEWRLEGDGLLNMKADGEAEWDPQPAEYCVEGTLVTVHMYEETDEGDPMELFMYLTK